MCGTSSSPSQTTNPAPLSQFTAEEEAELKLLREIQRSYCWNPNNILTLTEEEQEELDRRTVFVGNVDYGASVQEIEELFDVCGPVKVRFQTDRFTGRRKNHCFIELADPMFVQLATTLDQLVFRNRVISVKAKATKKTSEYSVPRQDFLHPTSRYKLINKKPVQRFNPYK